VPAYRSRATVNEGTMSQPATDYTIDELICVCIARQIEDGELVVQGIATPLVLAGYTLARLTHAPNIAFASAIGQTFCRDWAPLSIAHVEALWLGKALGRFDFAQAACELLPTYQPKEFFRPAQVDARGNTGNIVVGDYHKPRLRLPGCGGIADVTAYEEHVCFYVPRHSRVTFVEQVDLVSGLGVGAGPPDHPAPGPIYLISDLGQFDFVPGRMRLTSVHPGVTVERVQAKTGFRLEVGPDLQETPPPTVEEVRLLREVIDPLGTRELECLSGARRRVKLREIIEHEQGARAASVRRQ
jgi:acyl CoA:acetate/3-ketoacid CoA transferase beta subunit